MLVLSRKEGERLLIGGNITLVISKVVGNRVTIAIEAPKDIKVMRGELIELGVEALAPAQVNFAAQANLAAQVNLAAQAESSEKKPTERKSRVTSVGLKSFTTSVRMLQRNVG